MSSLKLVLTGLVLIYFRRSVRSSYAFAHQEGFGRLITSGKIMRQPPSAPYPAFQVRTFSTNFFEFFCLIILVRMPRLECRKREKWERRNSTSLNSLGIAIFWRSCLQFWHSSFGSLDQLDHVVYDSFSIGLQQASKYRTSPFFEWLKRLIVIWFWI